jgi:hypothetical protein
MPMLHTSTVNLKIRFGSASCQPSFAAYIAIPVSAGFVTPLRRSALDSKLREA